MNKIGEDNFKVIFKVILLGLLSAMVGTFIWLGISSKNAHKESVRIANEQTVYLKNMADSWHKTNLAVNELRDSLFMVKDTLASFEKDWLELSEENGQLLNRNRSYLKEISREVQQRREANETILKNAQKFKE